MGLKRVGRRVGMNVIKIHCMDVKLSKNTSIIKKNHMTYVLCSQ